MDASITTDSPFALAGPGRFTKASIKTAAGEIEARLSEAGNWELRVRRDDESRWRMACSGDLEGGTRTRELVVEENLICGPLVVWPEARQAFFDHTELQLARKEFSLLTALASDPNRVFSKEELLLGIWGYAAASKTRTLDSHASRLRTKLRKAGAQGWVCNCWGVGYRLWERPDLFAFGQGAPSEGAVADL